MKNDEKKNGEAAGRKRGYESAGGRPGNDILEDGQLRGVDDEGNVVTGTHGGPKRKPQVAPTRQSTPHHDRGEEGRHSTR